VVSVDGNGRRSGALWDVTMRVPACSGCPGRGAFRPMPASPVPRACTIVFSGVRVN
jgi:hypothetical protein